MTAPYGFNANKMLSGLFGVCVVLLAVTKTGDTDAWMHLSLGRLLWMSRGFPATEVFVYPSIDLPFNYSSWLFGVLYYLAHQAMRIHGVILLKAATVSAALFFMFKDSLRPYRNYAVSLLVLTSALVMMRHRFVERPETFAMLFLSLNIYCLNALVHDGKKRMLLVLPVINMLWANMHSSVVLMFVPFFSFLIGTSIERALATRGNALPPAPSASPLRSLALALGLSVAASLISPYFTGQYLFGAGQINDPFIKQQIGEMLPPTWDRTKWPYVLSVIVVLSFILNWRRFSVTQALLVLPFLILPFTAFRFLVFLGVVGGPVVARNLSAWAEDKPWRPLMERPAAAVMVATVTISCTVLSLTNTFTVSDSRQSPGFGIAEGSVPEEALSFLDRHMITGRVFNAFNWGGYIVWRDFPKRSVFVDPRGYLPQGLLEQRTSAEHLPQLLNDLERTYGFSVLLLSYPVLLKEDISRFETALEYTQKHDQWALVYWDDLSLVYLKRGGNHDALIRASEYRHIDPMRKLTSAQFLDDQYRDAAVRELTRNIGETGSAKAQMKLAYIYNDAGRYQEALDWYRKALEHPEGDRFTAYNGIAYALHGLRDDGEAMRYLRKALALREDPSILTNLGLWYLAEGDRREAARYLEKALRLNPNTVSLYPVLGRIYQQEGMTEKAGEIAGRQARVFRTDAGQEHFQNGTKAYSLHQYDRAIEEFQKSIEANPANPAVYSNLGYVYYDKGMMGRSFEFQKKAIEIDPNYANAYYGLALVYRNEGNLQAAKRQWERYLELEPAGYFSRRAREQIKAIAPD